VHGDATLADTKLSKNKSPTRSCLRPGDPRLNWSQPSPRLKWLQLTPGSSQLRNWLLGRSSCGGFDILRLSKETVKRPGQFFLISVRWRLKSLRLRKVLPEQRLSFESQTASRSRGVRIAGLFGYRKRVGAEFFRDRRILLVLQTGE